MVRRIVFLALGVTLLLQAGCRAGRGSALQGVIVVVLDTLRADHLGCYGYERPNSPAIDALAREGVRFSQVVSAAPWTLPSVSSLLAGRYSERVWQANRLTASLVETLRDAGLVTAAFTEGGFVSSHFGHDLGFGVFVEEEGAVQLMRPGQRRDPSKPGGIERTFDAAGRWLDAIGGDRFFLLVHTYEPHVPYTNRDYAVDHDPGRLGPVYTLEDMESVHRRELDLTADETAYVTALYDGDIRNSDRHVGGLLQRLVRLGLHDSVAVVITSDHGEELGEHYPHDVGNHGHALLDTQLMVPLVVHDPTRRYAVPVVESQVRTIDVMPTVAELLGVPVEPGLDGRSLVPLMTGAEGEDRLALAGQIKRGPWRVAVRWMAHKYIRAVPVARQLPPITPTPPTEQLYDLQADPREHANLAPRRPELVRTLDDVLLESHPGLDRSVGPTDADDLDPELLERLRSLGYLR